MLSTDDGNTSNKKLSTEDSNLFILSEFNKMENVTLWFGS